MQFPEALIAMKSGKLVRRTAWAETLVLALDDSVFKRYNPTHKRYLPYAFTSDDVLGTDWQVTEL